MAVLLIGSTGMGKSTLGNFLLDPDDLQKGGKHFKQGKDNYPQTQQTEIKKTDTKIQVKDQLKTKVESNFLENSSINTDKLQENLRTPTKNVGEKPEGNFTDDTKNSGEKLRAPTEDTSAGEIMEENDGAPTGEKPKEDSVAAMNPKSDVSKNTKEKPQNGARDLLKVKDKGPFKSKMEKTELIIIDTPGLNENEVKDLQHMIDLIETLQKFETIRACIFVVKFSSKIDQQYKDTVKYYSRLLPSLFEKNILIVMTNYATDERSEDMRQSQGIDLEETTTIVRKEIRSISGIDFDPIVFAIDNLPYGRAELSTSTKIRNDILSYIFSLHKIDLKNFLVAKTKPLLENDDKCVKTCEAEITGFIFGQIQENPQSEFQIALREIRERENAITKIDSELSQLEESRKEIDSDVNIVAATWSVDHDYSWLENLTSQREIDFSVISKWKISNIMTWHNENCTIQFYRKEKEVSGTIKRNNLYGMHASITLETEKREKFSEEILNLKKKIKQKKVDLEGARNEARLLSEKYFEFADEIKLLKELIEEKRETIKERLSTMLSLEKAHLSLEEIQSA